MVEWIGELDSEDWIAFATIVLAIIALLQLFVFGRQAKRLKETVDAMTASEARQAHQTPKQIEVAREANRIANKDRRPWVQITGARITDDFFPVQPAEDNWLMGFEVTLLNSGRTPAIQVSLTSHYFVGHWTPDNYVDLATALGNDPIDNVFVPMTALFPKSPMPLKSEHRMSRPQFSNLAVGSSISVVGFIDYLSTFDDGEKHRTWFCFHLYDAAGKEAFSYQGERTTTRPSEVGFKEAPTGKDPT